MLTELTRDSILGDGGGGSCQGDNGPVCHSCNMYYPKLTLRSHGADVPFTLSLPLCFSVNVSLSFASLLYIAGLNRSVERAWQTNRHSTPCVSGAGAAPQCAERISTVRRGPPTLTLPDHGAALQGSPGVQPKPHARRRQESPHLQFRNKSRQLLTGWPWRGGIT